MKQIQVHGEQAKGCYFTVLKFGSQEVKHKGLVFAYMYDKFIDRINDIEIPFECIEISTFKPSIVSVSDRGFNYLFDYRLSKINKVTPDKPSTYYTLPFEFRNSILITDIEDFNCIGQDMTFDFVESIIEDERYSDEGCGTQEGLKFLNKRGWVLLDRYKTRLFNLAKKIFTESDLAYFDVDPTNLTED